MSENSIIINAEDYQYPTTEELTFAYSLTPELCSFNFDSEYPMISLISRKKTIPEVYRDDQLAYWDNILLNRNGGLLHTYTNAIVHFKRGIPDDTRQFERVHFINRIQFDYYLEYFYYQFSTVCDTLGQILNAYFDLGIPVNKIHFNEAFVKRITDIRISGFLSVFLKDTATAKEFRNRLTHRAPINHPDSRSSMTFEKGRYSYGSARNDSISSSEIKDNLDSTIHTLSKLLDNLKNNIGLNGSIFYTRQKFQVWQNF